ncbi:hypothetical protein GLIP_0527 [Aliiglaciecola lipolytica E3]|uniref:Uncharacterized protein n=1 Tax=Aliiglaciecola lipolytica E3 TaxID=1127673 RepID=K6Y931_9ALTE|nr:hypothetical protein GLIP_0527 [Aliiglaciecola lipolytica E3]
MTRAFGKFVQKMDDGLAEVYLQKNQQYEDRQIRLEAMKYCGLPAD